MLSKDVNMDKYSIHMTDKLDDSGISLPEFYFTFNAFKNMVNVGKRYVKLGPGTSSG